MSRSRQLARDRVRERAEGGKNEGGGQKIDVCLVRSRSATFGVQAPEPAQPIKLFEFDVVSVRFFLFLGFLLALYLKVGAILYQMLAGARLLPEESSRFCECVM